MKSRLLSAGCWILVISVVLCSEGSAQTFTNGDVFVAVNATVQWWHNGTLVRTLVPPTGGLASGMAFDTAGKLYVTMFYGQAVSIFNTNGNYAGTFGSGYNEDPESIVFDAAGNAYVGQADGLHHLLKFDAAGNLLEEFSPAVEDGGRGTDWIDLLAVDQCTMRYTSEGWKIKQFNVCSGTQLGDFNNCTLPGWNYPAWPSSNAFALRILPSGGVLVADWETIVRLDSGGNVVRKYDVDGHDSWFALTLDPDGTSFWAGDYNLGDVFKFDITTGAVLTSFQAGSYVGGIVVKGNIAVAPPPVANFTADPPGGVPPLTVTFTDLSVGNITSRWWTFGEGPWPWAEGFRTHTYNYPGTYTATLWVTGPTGSNTLSRVITVSNNYNLSSDTYSWVDPIAAGHTNVPVTLNQFSTQSLPFTFTFYGSNYNSVVVGHNGLLGFGSVAGMDSRGPTELPNCSEPNNIICPFWFDFYTNDGEVRVGTIGTAPNRAFVVSWLSMHECRECPDPYTFQVLLFEGSNNIKMQYNSIGYNGDYGAAIGVENSNGSIGRLYAFNGYPSPLSSGQALRFITLQRIGAVPPLSPALAP